MLRRILALLFAAFAAAAIAAPEAIVVPGEPVVAEKASGPAPRLRLQAKAAAVRAALSPVTAVEVESVRQANTDATAKRFMIGVNRAVLPVQGGVPAADNASWTNVEGGYAAQFSVTSPDAAALRASIDLRGTPLGVEMVFFGSAAPAQLLGPVRVGDIADRTVAWWSPVTEGDTLNVEVFVPAGLDPAATAFRMAEVSHLFTSAASGFNKRVQDIGRSGSCNVDVVCGNPSQAFLNTRNAVAKMLFTVGGGTGLCTGTLLNDTDPSTQIPWFYGANHCFDAESPPYRSPAQMQQIASTLNTYWFFEATACGSMAANPNFVQRFGGATYMYNNQPADVLFLRLNESAPAGAFLSGYSAQPFNAGQNATGIHHPQGDLKKVSQGTIQGFSTPDPRLLTSGFTEIRWFSGTTEGGSSGSGLWYFDGAQYLFRGGLFGGTALCSNPQGTDNYSRFDLVYQTLRQFLESAATPFANFTDLWWNPNESGWGLNLIQHANNQMFGVWYTYGADGKRLWIVMPEGQWTSSSTFTGALYIVSGPPYSAAFTPGNVHVNPVGNATLSFTNTNAGTWTYSVNGVSGVKTISRQPF